MTPHKTSKGKKCFLVTYPQCAVPKEDILKFFKDYLGEQFKYVCVSEEDHHETEGVHRHVFFQCKDNVKILKDQMHELDIEGHHPNIEKCFEPYGAVEYVKKDGVWIEEGESQYRVIKRKMTKAEKNKIIMKKEDDIIGLVEEGVISLREVNTIDRALMTLRNIKLKVKAHTREQPDVMWFYGETGTGKTREAIRIANEEFEGDFWISNKGKLDWFDGYQGQRVAILDDIRKGSTEFNTLLRLLDRYPMQVPIKGGFTWWVPEKIIITCPIRPEELFIDHQTKQAWDHLDQLIRRLGDIIEFKGTLN